MRSPEVPHLITVELTGLQRPELPQSEMALLDCKELHVPDEELQRRKIFEK
jgi:hypothetical protein